MDQLIELLGQIQELAGAAIDALKGADKASGGGEGKPMHHGGPPEPNGPEEPGGKPEGREGPADEKPGGRY